MREDRGAGITGCQDIDMTQHLCNTLQLIPRMLSLLACLQPIQNPRRALDPSQQHKSAFIDEQEGGVGQNDPDQGKPSVAGNSNSETATAPHQDTSTLSASSDDTQYQTAGMLCRQHLPTDLCQDLPVKPPYHGYRGDILAVIANIMHDGPKAADEVAAVPGAIMLMLSQVGPAYVWLYSCHSPCMHRQSNKIPHTALGFPHCQSSGSHIAARMAYEQ